jgi:uncharacterized protein (DUF305 family)
MNNMKTNLIALVAVVVVAVLGLFAGYAWGNNKSDSGTSSAASAPALSSVADRASATGHNAADGMFAMMMTEHHTQAIEMAKLAPTRASSQQVKDLAAKIEAAQGPEIDKMAGWMDDWGTSGDMSNMHMDGKMSASDMTSLQKSSGTAFDKMFLQMMIQHHEGATKMAASELKGGKNGDAMALAASIMVSQQGEISLMKELLK